MKITRSYYFSSAHFLPKVAEGHKCKSTHGHNFKVSISVKSEVDKKTGMGVDFFEVDKAVEPLIKSLDHTTLNKITGLSNPTSENICLWFYDRLKGAFSIFSIEVFEDENTSCLYEVE